MAVFVDPDSGKRYNNVPEEDAEKAQTKYGLVPLAEYELQQEKGGFLGNAEAALVSVGRPIASGVAAAARGISSAYGDVDPMGNPVTTSDPALDIHGQDIAPGLFNESANRAVAANPTTAAIARSVPLVAGSLALAPETGGASLGLMLGLDAADAAAQEAVDADLAGRGIEGAHILRNGLLNMAFTGMAHGIGVAGQALVRGADNVATRAAKTIVSKAEEYGTEAIGKRTAAVIDQADEALSSVKMPKPEYNPNAQRSAVEELADRLQKTDPGMSRQVEEYIKGNASTRYSGLHELRAGMEEVNESIQAMDQILGRADLWGQKAVAQAEAIKTARMGKPPPGASPDLVAAYADTLRQLPGGKFAKQADALDELAQMKALDPIAEKAAGVIASAAANKGTRIAATAVGGAVGGWPGAWIGQGIGEILAPAAEGAAKQITPKLSQGLLKMGEGLKQYAENDARVTAHLLVSPESSARFMRVMGTVPSPIARFQGDDDNIQQAFQRHRSMLQSFRTNPDTMLDSITEEIGGTQDVAPELHRQMAEQAFKVSGFLQEKMPKPKGISVARPNGTPATPLEMRTYALYATAALDPGSVFADARAGKLRREQVETLQRLWPTEYTNLRNAVVQQLGQGKSSTVVRQRMNLLFGFGASVDPALGPAVTAMVKAAREAKPSTPSASAPGIRSASPPSQSSMTPAGQASMQLLSSGDA